MQRRKFIIKLLAGLGGFFGLLAFDAFWFERYIINWTSFDISDRDRNKLKAVQLSDLHLYGIKSFHHAIADRINRERPDVIFITGDAINYNQGLPVLNTFLSLIDRDIPKLAILGNVEYSGNVDIDALKGVYQKQNGELLINNNCILKTKGRTLNVVGIDDYLGGNSDYYLATKDMDVSVETIVLNHCPEYRDDIERINRNRGVSLKVILSGHTHGGQITFFGKAIFKPAGSGRYLKGWYKSKESQMYVSKGIGTSVLPIRFGARAEATLFYI